MIKQKLKATPFIMVICKDMSLLEHSPETQYKFNRTCALFWFLCMCVIPFIPKAYGHDIGVLLVLEVSLWANTATHFSGMSSALAAVNTSKNVDDMADDIDDIHQMAETIYPEIAQPDTNL